MDYFFLFADANEGANTAATATIVSDTISAASTAATADAVINKVITANANGTHHASSSIVILVGLISLSVPLFLILSLWIAALFSPGPGHVIYKLYLLQKGIVNLLLSKDKKWKKQGDPAHAKPIQNRKKRVLFIRHGESEWNVVFNQWSNGRWKSFPRRLFEALKMEVLLFVSPDSVFVDSPLSELGTEQALQLQSFIESRNNKTGKNDGEDESQLNGNASNQFVQENIEYLKGTNSAKSVIASSNLRRALSTCTIALWHRLKRSQEKIHILSSLQEVTFNIDGVALARPQQAPVLSDVELKAVGKTPSEFEYDRYFDCVENFGDKPIRGKGIDRLNDFAAWCFKREEDIIIAAGHSLYFRFFFQTFLPHGSTHVSKKNKIANGGVIAFDLLEASFPNGKISYTIDENSITPIHFGFEEESKKKKSG